MKIKLGIRNVWTLNMEQQNMKKFNLPAHYNCDGII